VVAEPLVEPCDQRHFDRYRGRHLGGGEFGHQAGVQVVHLVVHLGQGRGSGAVPLVPAVRGLAPHVAGKLAHPLDEPAAARRQFRGEKMAGPGGDLAFQVVSALQFRRDPQHGQ
jgi:hypothetical protein